MGSTPIQPRPLTSLEAAVIAKLLSAGCPDSTEYSRQVPFSQVVSTWGFGSPSVDIKVRPGAPAAGDVRDGIFANGAVADTAGSPVGEIILWVAGGWLSGIEYAWYSATRPTLLPEPDQIDLL
jgi:hypothetical protein